MLAYEYKLKGTEEQFRRIDEAIRTIQFVRNKAIRYWMENSVAGKFDLCKLGTRLAVEYPFVEKLGSQARQSACERAWASISKFYLNCKNNKSGKKGYPKFQKNCRSVEYRQSGWKLIDGCKRLRLTDGHKIGTLKLMGNQPLNDVKGKIKRVRVIRRADGYYAQFVVDIERQETFPFTGGMVGLDVGLTHFYTDSNGTQIENPRYLRKSEKKLKRLHRRLSKKKKGSVNRKKAKNRLARKYLHVQRQRKDFVTKLARSVCQSNDLIAFEDLKISSMVKNRCLAKSINDAAWYLFRTKLEYYSKLFGKMVVAVRPNHTSQLCSGCGDIVMKSLSERIHRCACGTVLCRDHNAAINILNRGIEQLSTAGNAGFQACGEENLCSLLEGHQ